MRLKGSWLALIESRVRMLDERFEKLKTIPLAYSAPYAVVLKNTCLCKRTGFTELLTLAFQRLSRWSSMVGGQLP